MSTATVNTLETIARIRAEVCALHAELTRYQLVVWTAGNVSARVPSRDLLVIKPSGISYDDLTPEQMVVTDLYGVPVDGDADGEWGNPPLSPSSDTAAHAYVYRNMPDVGVAIHGHPVEVGDHHLFRRQVVIGDAGRFDDQQVAAGNAGGDVAGGPHHELVAGQLGVQGADLGTDPGDGFQGIYGGGAHAEAPTVAVAAAPAPGAAGCAPADLRWMALSRCITSLAPRPK